MVALAAQDTLSGTVGGGPEDAPLQSSSTINSMPLDKLLLLSLLHPFLHTKEELSRQYFIFLLSSPYSKGASSPHLGSSLSVERVSLPRVWLLDGSEEDLALGLVLVTGLIPSRTEPETRLEGCSRVQCCVQDSGQPCIRGSERPPCWTQQTKVRCGLKTHAGTPSPHNISVGWPGTQPVRLHDGRPAQSVSRLL